MTAPNRCVKQLMCGDGFRLPAVEGVGAGLHGYVPSLAVGAAVPAARRYDSRISCANRVGRIGGARAARPRPVFPLVPGLSGRGGEGTLTDVKCVYVIRRTDSR